ncbi:MAG: FtsX-like permease family protein [Victivallaceae bacterium]|nr:FtsX-like permease family protein [Victivallaceae bacterium]MDD5662768.1 FtsX-like permease family protein [Victivallaceae bacterium]
MNLRTEFFLAKRYLRPERSAVSLIAAISLLGVVIGVAVLIVVLAVFSGFTALMREKLLDTRAHFQIYSVSSNVIANPRSVVSSIEECGGRGMPLVMAPALLQKGGEFIPKKVLAADFTEAEKHFRLKVSRAQNIDPVSAANSAWISEEIATECNLKTGDRIWLHTPERLARIATERLSGKSGPDSEVRAQSFSVTGIYQIGKYDFDKETIFISLEAGQKLFELPHGTALTVYGWMPDPFDMDSEFTALATKLPGGANHFRVYTWRQLNAQMFGMLQSQKSMMFFIFFFIVLVAAFSIGNTLITIVFQKSREIGLQKALGATPFSMMRVFVWQGMLVGILGSIGGILLGVTMLKLRNDFMALLERISGRELFPKEMYYFDSLPAKIEVGDVGLIAVAAVLLCTLGAVLPALRAASLEPARALRDE